MFIQGHDVEVGGARSGPIPNLAHRLDQRRYEQILMQQVQQGLSYQEV